MANIIGISFAVNKTHFRLCLVPVGVVMGIMALRMHCGTCVGSDSSG